MNALTWIAGSRASSQMLLVHSMRFGSKNYFAARRAVAKLHQWGELTEDKVFEFAHSLKFNETGVALSLLCSISIDIVERALVDKNREPILILAKALGFSWTTAMSLLFLGAPDYRITAGDLDQLKIDFFRLNVVSCDLCWLIDHEGGRSRDTDVAGDVTTKKPTASTFTQAQLFLYSANHRISRRPSSKRLRRHQQIEDRLHLPDRFPPKDCVS